MANNYIGLNQAGTAAVPNGFGVVGNPSASNVSVGNGTANGRNVISGNTFEALSFTQVTATTLYGNWIGVAGDGTTALGNGDAIAAARGATGVNSGITVGSTASGHGNLIAHNTLYGVFVGSNSSDASHVAISGNSMFGNGHGIVLTGDPSPCTTAGPSAGHPNEWSPCLAISGITSNGTSWMISGTAYPGSLVQVFVRDPGSANVQGKTYLGQATAAGGTWSVSTPLINLTGGQQVTTTASEVNGVGAFVETSQFGAPTTVPGG